MQPKLLRNYVYFQKSRKSFVQIKISCKQLITNQTLIITIKSHLIFNISLHVV